VFGDLVNIITTKSQLYGFTAWGTNKSN